MGRAVVVVTDRTTRASRLYCTLQARLARFTPVNFRSGYQSVPKT